MEHAYRQRTVACHEMLRRWIHQSLLLFLLLSLLLSFVSSSEGGQYSYFGEQAYDKPIFRSTVRNYTVGPGERAVLKCRIENLGTKQLRCRRILMLHFRKDLTLYDFEKDKSSMGSYDIVLQVTWRKEGEQHPLTIGLFTFVPDARITVDYNNRQNEWSLIINPVKLEDEGVYHCNVVTKGDNTYEITLNVKKEIPMVGPAVLVSGTKILEKSERLSLTCNATGKLEPPHSVDWYKDGIKIESSKDNGISITKQIEPTMLISKLEIERTQMEDSGDYVCRSSNKDTATIHIQILDVPNINVKRDSEDHQYVNALHLSSSVVPQMNYFLFIITIVYLILNNSRTLSS